MSGANYKNINDHKYNDDENEEREILVGKLLNLQTFTGEYLDDDDYDYNDLDVYGLVDLLEELVMPFRALIVNKLYEEVQDLLYKVLTSKIEYAFAKKTTMMIMKSTTGKIAKFMITTLFHTQM